MGLTQAEAAAKLEVTRVTIGNWEKGRIKPRKTVRMAMLALALPNLQDHAWPE